MKVILICGVALGLSISPLRAGSVNVLGDAAEVDGKLTLTSTAVHVEGSSTTDIKFPDILEASFAESPFRLDYFCPKGDTLNHLPAAWKAQDMEHVDIPGSFTYADGELTINAVGANVQRKEPGDKLYFIGQPWTGDGQWTVRIKESDAEAGLMLRDSLDHTAVMYSMGITGRGESGIFHNRDHAGDHSAWGGGFPAELPIWLRLTRSGQSIDGAISSDGEKWETLGQNNIKVSGSAWIGFFVNSFNEKKPTKAVLDQIFFTPRSAQQDALPPGVLLRSGTFLTGGFNGLDPNNGNFNRNGKDVTMTTDQIAAVVWHQESPREIARVAGQTGLIMKNGDFLESDLQSIHGGGIQMTSLVLGQVAYYSDSVRACVLHPLKLQPSDYEIRLKDGSIVRASGLGVTNGQLVIAGVSGITVNVDPGEVAQFRAGPARVQSLLDIPWKLTPPPVANSVPAANPAPDQPPLVQNWTGPNQEQIMVIPSGTTLDFPLRGKFRALAMRIALSPDASPNSQATVRILVDGKEASRTTAIKAGDQPRFVEVTLQDPKTVTLTSDSIFAGTKVLFIDPVAIRMN